VLRTRHRLRQFSEKHLLCEWYPVLQLGVLQDWRDLRQF
jgi:hypothetical protein